MADNVAIKLRFRQQVAAEALKNIPKRAKRLFLGSIARASLGRVRTILVGREGCKNRYMKREGIDARTLVRTQTIHLCLDSQFNLPGLIVPIGINIYDVPGRRSSRRDVSDLSFYD